MTFYKSKPVVLKAIKFEKGITSSDVMEVFGTNPIKFEPPRFFVETLGGKVEVSLGDYVIEGVKGEFYPCKPDIFEATYELVGRIGDE